MCNNTHWYSVVNMNVTDILLTVFLLMSFQRAQSILSLTGAVIGSQRVVELFVFVLPYNPFVDIHFLHLGTYIIT